MKPKTGNIWALRFSSVTGVVTIAGLLSGCANFSTDAGMNFVKSEAGGELGKDIVKVRTEADAAATKARVDALLKKPMTADTAVQVALLMEAEGLLVAT